MFCHIVPCFYFIFPLIFRLFPTHPDSHLIFSAVAPCVIRHCCQCCQRSHRCNFTVQRISHCFQLTCFDLKQDAAFQQTLFADFLFHLCIFKDVVRLKQTRIVHTLETINHRPAHKRYTAGIFPYLRFAKILRIFIGKTSSTSSFSHTLLRIRYPFSTSAVISFTFPFIRT